MLFAAIALVALGAGLFFGCRQEERPSGQPAADACVGVQRKPAPGSGAGITTLLVDRSASVRGAEGVNFAAAPELDAEIRAAAGRGDTITISGFDGSATTTAWATVAIPDRANEQERLETQVGALRCARQLLAQAAAEPARAAGSDVLGGLSAAAGQLAVAGTGQRHVVVATDGLANTGCANLLESPVGGDTAPTVDQCRSGGQLPDLTGAQVTMLGIGHPAGDQPIPGTAQLGWVTSLWKALCGAATADPRTCDIHSVVDAPAGGAGATRAPERTPGVEDPGVTFPQVEERRASGTMVVALPDRMLFATNSTELLGIADEALAEVRRRVRETSGKVIQVVGHTDSRGTDAHNDLLSLGRAQRVTDALRASGIPVGEVVGQGRGHPDPACGPERRPDGSADLTAMSCNRRVEIVISLGEAD